MTRTKLTPKPTLTPKGHATYTRGYTLAVSTKSMSYIMPLSGRNHTSSDQSRATADNTTRRKQRKMLIKGIFTSISGSIGGVTGSHNKGGQYLRARTNPTNPNTAAQQRARTAFTAASEGWSGITPEERISWGAFAQQQAWTNRLGDAIQLSGQNAYVASYAALTAAGLTPVDTPPPPNTRPAGFSFPAEITLAINPPINTFGGFDGYGGEVGDRIVVAIGRPVPPGVTFYKGPYQIAISEPADSTGPALGDELAAAMAALQPLAVDQRIPIRIRIVNATGQYSEFTETISLAGEII